MFPLWLVAVALTFATVSFPHGEGLGDIMNILSRLLLGTLLCAAGFAAIGLFAQFKQDVDSQQAARQAIDRIVASLEATAEQSDADAMPKGVLPENAALRTNEAGLAIIRESEGLRLSAYNYGGVWLIGYGHTATAAQGMTITESEAEALLRADVMNAETGVRTLVQTPVNENEFSAMVSLAYNLGVGGFSRTLVLERLDAGDRAGAADGFLTHDRARVDGVLQALPNLTERRRKERELFLTPA